MNAPGRPARRGRKQRPADSLPSQIEWRDIRNHMAPLAPLSADQIESIHQASLRLLEEYGIEVMSEKARALYRQAGAEVDDTSMMVRADRGLIEAALASAPSSFTLTPVNPAHALHVGGDHIHFGLVSGAPNVHDIRGGRRSGNFADYKKLMKLGQSFNVIHFFGNQTLAPNDLPVNTRHLDTCFVNLTMTDKVFLSMSIGEGRVRDAARLTAIARGLTMDQLAADPTSITNININSPRKFDTEMSAAAMAMAEMGQATVITPFTLMGAMTPVTLAAALTQQNAEALFGIALTQLVRPGAPVVYGGFTSNVDMKTGAPAFGTPENTRQHRRRPARAALQPSLPDQRLQRLERGRRTGGVGDADGAVGRGHRPWQPHLSFRRMGRGWACRRFRETDRRLRDAAGDGRIPVAAKLQRCRFRLCRA